MADSTSTNIELDKLANDLLERGHQYCVDGTKDRLERVQKHISRIESMLAKENDAKKILSLTTSLKTLVEMEAKLQEGAIVFFMAQYKPLKNLIDTTKKITTSDTVEIEDGEIVEDDEIDLNDVYRQYED